VRGGEILTRGDMLHFEAGGVGLGIPGDTSLVWAAVDGQEGESAVKVIVDGDGVYAVTDAPSAVLAHPQPDRLTGAQA
jgi:hypothetical protein